MPYFLFSHYDFSLLLSWNVCLLFLFSFIVPHCSSFTFEHLLLTLSIVIFTSLFSILFICWKNIFCWPSPHPPLPHPSSSLLSHGIECKPSSIYTGCTIVPGFPCRTLCDTFATHPESDRLVTWARLGAGCCQDSLSETSHQFAWTCDSAAAVAVVWMTAWKYDEPNSIPGLRSGSSLTAAAAAAFATFASDTRDPHVLVVPCPSVTRWA